MFYSADAQATSRRLKRSQMGSIVTSILFVTVLWFGFRARKLTVTGISLGAIAFLLGAIGVMILAVLGWWLMRSLNPSLQVLLIGNYQANLALLN